MTRTIDFQTLVTDTCVTDTLFDRLARAVVDTLREPARRRGHRPFHELSPGLRAEWMKEGRGVAEAVLFELRLAFDDENR